MKSNPHLEMANEVFNMMFGLPKILPPDPIDPPTQLPPELTDEQETSHD